MPGLDRPRRPRPHDRARPDDTRPLYRGSNLVAGSKRRIAGLSLRATDTEWSAGSGPVVTGPMKSLLLTMAGRAAALDELAGDGVEVLRARM